MVNFMNFVFFNARFQCFLNRKSFSTERAFKWCKTQAFVHVISEANHYSPFNNPPPAAQNAENHFKIKLANETQKLWMLKIWRKIELAN
jgi:hypothetical protein